MTTVIYPRSWLYSGNRPYADVILAPGHSKAITYKCLVDTGADYLQLPASAASLVGINLGSARPIGVATVAGRTTLQLVTGQSVDIEGCRITADVLFDPANATNLIAGRLLLLAAFDVGFNVSEWMATK